MALSKPPSPVVGFVTDFAVELFPSNSTTTTKVKRGDMHRLGTGKLRVGIFFSQEKTAAKKRKSIVGNSKTHENWAQDIKTVGIAKQQGSRKDGDSTCRGRREEGRGMVYIVWLNMSARSRV